MNDSVMRHTDSTHPIVVTFNVGSATIKMAAYDTAKAVDSFPLAWSPLFDININLKTKNKVWHAMPQSLSDWEPQDSLTDTAVSLFTRVKQAFPARKIVCIHRVVHGGKRYHVPVVINETVMAH